jgi:acetylornithine deacetylase/succinyl-diaminopimelate desuccinylase family protein
MPPETTRILSDLVRLPSINPMGRALQGEEFYEHRVTAYLEDFFRTLGVPFERQPIAPLRDNIIARFEQLGPRSTYIFDAHQDTVPVDNMEIDPFGAVIKDGQLYGRGSCDIKGGMSAMLAAFARLVREKPKHSANIIMLCTVDEEHTFLGVQRFVRDKVQADGAIVAEPTGLRIVHTHKGAARWHLETSGHACHSSSPEKGINAIYRMGHLLPALEAYAASLTAGRHDPYLGPATLSVGRIEGGASVNTVPDRCRIEIDRRLIPGEDATQARNAFENYLNRHTQNQIPFQSFDPWMSLPALPAEGPPGKTELVQRLNQVLEKAGHSQDLLAVPYGTNASILAQAAIPSLVFGPGDIANAHTCDEHIELDEVAEAGELLYRFATVD